MNIDLPEISTLKSINVDHLKEKVLDKYRSIMAWLSAYKEKVGNSLQWTAPDGYKREDNNLIVYNDDILLFWYSGRPWLVTIKLLGASDAYNAPTKKNHEFNLLVEAGGDTYLSRKYNCTITNGDSMPLYLFGSLIEYFVNEETRYKYHFRFIGVNDKKWKERPVEVNRDVELNGLKEQLKSTEEKYQQGSFVEKIKTRKVKEQLQRDIIKLEHDIRYDHRKYEEKLKEFEDVQAAAASMKSNSRGIEYLDKKLDDVVGDINNAITRLYDIASGKRSGPLAELDAHFTKWENDKSQKI